MISPKKYLQYGMLTFVLMSCAHHPATRFSKAVNSSNQCQILAGKREALAAASRKAKKAHRRSATVAQKKTPVQKKIIVTPETVFAVEAATPHEVDFGESAVADEVVLASETVTAPSVIVSPAPELSLPIVPTATLETALKDSVAETSALAVAHYAYGLPALLGCSALAAMSILYGFQERSKNITRWAAAHPWTARGLIAGAQVATGAAMGVAGHYLHVEGYVVPDLVRYASLTGLTASTLLYPDVHNKMYWTPMTYFRQKFHDVSVFASGAAIMLFVGNHYSVTTQPPVADAQYVTSLADFGTSVRVVKKEVPAAVQSQEPAKKKSHSKEIWLTVLASIGFTALFLLVAALACEVSCAGSGAGAIAIFLVGEVGLAFLFAAVIRKIWGIPRKKDRKAAIVAPTK